MKTTNLNTYYNKMLGKLQTIFRAERKKSVPFFISPNPETC